METTRKRKHSAISPSTTKWYAVRAGRKVGLFDNWPDTQASVRSFRGAQYKSFPSKQEASQWLDDAGEKEAKAAPPPPIPSPDSPKPPTHATTASTLHIYTDGSHRKSTREMGYGLYAIDEKGQHYGISQRVENKEMVTSFGFTKKDLAVISNPTMELCATAHALRVASRAQVPRPNLVIYADYVGSSKWIVGEWGTEKTYIRRIVEMARGHLRTLKRSGVSVSFKWVRGHSGVDGNEKADELAKGTPSFRFLPLDELLDAPTQGTRD